MTVKDTYPFPRMDEFIDKFGEAQYFTTLHAYYGYWQIPISKQHSVAIGLIVEVVDSAFENSGIFSRIF